MTKFRLYYDKDKETTWLNQMAKDGYAMTGFFAGFYTFEKCEPGEYLYQMDFGSKFFSIDENYREFMTEQGVEILQSWGYWILLRKPAAAGDFQLYTDVDSSIEHYTKIRNMFKVVTIVELLCFILECLAAGAGNTWAIFFAVLLGILVLVLMKATLHTNQIINELKERKGEYTATPDGKVSPVLLCGLMLNVCALAINQSVSAPIGIAVQILAIVFMLVGLYQSRHVFKN